MKLRPYIRDRKSAPERPVWPVTHRRVIDRRCQVRGGAEGRAEFGARCQHPTAQLGLHSQRDGGTVTSRLDAANQRAAGSPGSGGAHGRLGHLLRLTLTLMEHQRARLNSARSVSGPAIGPRPVTHRSPGQADAERERPDIDYREDGSTVRRIIGLMKNA
ncbi:hypothetical protein AAFF_G00310700 [Aldrovandia affinis]|uniref:Uncharacterized protein n=1 Tax=Aldrovandia affinis TaxID=143900 RepID=A0AAD7R886_9TELE|nr:hypothetical protein AAFF_G00310700 [Aldrovandia affinis]